MDDRKQVGPRLSGSVLPLHAGSWHSTGRQLIFNTETRRLVAEGRVARLATADAAGAPHVMPVCYALDGETVYSVVDRKPKRAGAMRLRRIRNIVANPQVALLLDGYDEDWSRLWYVLLRGVASIVSRGPEHRWALTLLRNKYPQYAAMNLEGRPVIRVRLLRVVKWGNPEL